jgi:hypothetical protein
MSTFLSDLHEIDGFWYVATVYTKHPAGIDEAAKEAARATAWLMKRGVPCFSPICHTHSIAIEGGIDPLDHGFWLPADDPMMRKAHGLIVMKMPGWEESHGIAYEIGRFEGMQKPVIRMQWPQPVRYARPNIAGIGGWAWDEVKADFWRTGRLGEGTEWMGWRRANPHVQLVEIGVG